MRYCTNNRCVPEELIGTPEAPARMHCSLIRSVVNNPDRLTIANGMLSLLGSTLSEPFAPHLKQAPPQSVNTKPRREQEVVEADFQSEGDVPDAESNLRVENDDPFTDLGKGTDRLIENFNADVGVGPAVESVNTQSGEKAAEPEKKRRRKEEKAKTKEAAVKRPPLKKKKKEKVQP